MSVVISPEQLVARAKRMRDEIDDIFRTVEHWNTSVRKPHEERIDPDPDRQLEKALAQCNSIISEFETKESRS